MTETKELTLGQRRVRMSFNPSSNYDVDNIKTKAAELIDLCEDFRKKLDEAGFNGTEEGKRDADIRRCLSLAQTHFEDAAMWAVKAVTG